MFTRRLVNLVPLSAVLLALALAMGTGTSATTSAEDAQPQGVFPNNRWDWNNDACPDFFDSFIGGIQMHAGSCAGAGSTVGFGDPVSMGIGGIDQYLLGGDWDADGCKDMIWVIGSGLYLGAGNCGTGFKDVEPPFLADASAYNYFVAPGYWNQDFVPDLLARRTSDNALVLLLGNGPGPIIETMDIGTGWHSADIILGLGDFDGDACSDVGARRIEDNLLYLYPGDCSSGEFKPVNPTVIGPGVEWENADWLVSGADWFRVQGQTCPDILSWNASSPAGLGFLPGNCDGQLYAGGGGLSQQDPFVAPFPSDNSTLSIWGDGDCGRSVAPRDGQADLKFFLQQTPLTQEYGCLPIGTQITVNGTTQIFGDWDCNGAVAPRDGQSALTAFLGKPPLTQTQPCPPMGKQVPLFAQKN
jgi:hypothetical protein